MALAQSLKKHSGFCTRQRERIANWGPLRTVGYYLFAVLPGKLGIQILSAFEFTGQPSPPMPNAAVSFSVFRTPDDWSIEDLEWLRELAVETSIHLYCEFIARGDRCVVGRQDGAGLACICWVERTTTYPFALGEQSVLIHNCYTVPAHRGKGLYPLALQFACHDIQSEGEGRTRILIECATVNYASKWGIQKAGFKFIGHMVQAFNRNWRLWAARH